MTDFLKIAKSIVVHFAHICAYGVETVKVCLKLVFAYAICFISTIVVLSYTPLLGNLSISYKPISMFTSHLTQSSNV